jgi:FAD dependent oxidoreductase TIGR03364
VVVLERDPKAAGASVRHGGQLLFSAAASGDLDCAATARARWLELAERAGTPLADAGTLILARTSEELSLMEAVATEPERRGRVLTPAEVEALAPIPIRGLVGGLHAVQDMRLDPRSAAPALARLLTRDPEARIEWGAHVHDVEPGLVCAGSVRVRAQAIVLCPGSGRQGPPPSLEDLQIVPGIYRSHMLRVAVPVGRRYRPNLATAASLLDYAGFARMEVMERLRVRMELERPELVERGVSLELSQLPHGDLIVGSTQTDATASEPFAFERLDRLLLEEATRLLGFAPVVKQRWRRDLPAPAADVPDDFLVTAPGRGVRVVQALSGASLALCHVKAAAVLDEIGGGPEVSAPITVRDNRRPAAGVRAHAQAFAKPAASHP